jgi:fatty-acyl-CoA synthase
MQGRAAASDRRVATGLFIDMVGSTQVAARPGGRHWCELAGFHRKVRRALRQHRRRGPRLTGTGAGSQQLGSRDGQFSHEQRDDDMKSTMQDGHLTLTSLFRRGRDLYGADAEVVTWAGDGSARASFAQVADRAERLAAALKRLGVSDGECVGSLMWNNQEHMEAYLAVPSMGAVLHTLNLRLSPAQLAFVINHGGDRVVIVDDTLVPVLAKVRTQLRTVDRIVVTGSGDASELGAAIRYEDLIADEKPGFDFPDHLDERSAASMCYTTGTTGDPKGVVYSHRSVYLHSLASWGSCGLTERDRALLIVPMFHVNAWGFPYTGWMLGADLLMPDRFLQSDPLTRFIEAERPTFSGAVPTVWNDILRFVETTPRDLSSLRLVACGGSAVPRSLMERAQGRHGVLIVQGWGMTETSPICALGFPPKSAAPGDEMDWRAKTGRVVPGVELRIAGDDGSILAPDGQSIGEIEVRGPWITGEYYGMEAPERFHDGWLRTGDVGTLDSRGYIQITDRTKDVIKSGGEWISSVELENAIMAHPDVVEAAVVGVPDPRWEERPLAVVVIKQGMATEPGALREHLASTVARWWLPERWAMIAEIPKTSVGKFDKKVLRAMYAEGRLEVVEIARADQR